MSSPYRTPRTPRKSVTARGLVQDENATPTLRRSSRKSIVSARNSIAAMQTLLSSEDDDYEKEVSMRMERSLRSRKVQETETPKSSGSLSRSNYQRRAKAALKLSLFENEMADKEEEAKGEDEDYSMEEDGSGSEDEEEQEEMDVDASEEDDDSENQDDDEEVDQESPGIEKKNKIIAMLKKKAVLPASPSSSPFTSVSLGETNHEAYLLADNRLKYKAVSSKDVVVPNDARKGRRPRKGTRGIGGVKPPANLPERTKSNFSVTKEGIRAAESLGLVSEGKHSREIQDLFEKKIRPDFSRWLSFMRKDFNVAIYGFGSKCAVSSAFQEYLDGLDLDVATINGLYPKLNARKILSDIVASLKLKISVKGSTVEDMSNEVCSQMPDAHSPLFIIVNNFDFLALNNPTMLKVLCALAKVKWIHIFATTDSINTCLGVTQNQAIALNFCWISCSTFEPYFEEFQWTPSIYGDSRGSKGTESTLQYVLKSLTGNARKAFSILATLQLSKIQAVKGKKGSEFVGVDFSELSRKCKDNFIAHNDTVLRTLLVEFVDHKLVTHHQGKRKGVGNLLTIDLETEVLERLLKDGTL